MHNPARITLSDWIDDHQSEERGSVLRQPCRDEFVYNYVEDIFPEKSYTIIKLATKGYLLENGSLENHALRRRRLTCQTKLLALS